MTRPPVDRCYTVMEVARRWRCRPTEVRKLIRKGHLFAFHGPGRGPRVPPEALAEYEQGHNAAELPKTRRKKRDPNFIEYF